LRFAVAVAVGPSMHNFREMAETFDRAGAWRRVADERELAAAWSEWIDRPERARALGQAGRALVDANRGALQPHAGPARAARRAPGGASS
jgi:3-deoxy-D-manno-octulosonic-acid transferase